MLSDSKLKGEVENVRFAWRPLEVSNRLQRSNLTIPAVPPLSFLHSRFP